MKTHACVHSGIEIVGNINWGTHFCKLYETEQDKLSIVVSYFRKGLENNEYCVWVTSDENEKESITAAMKNIFSNFDEILENKHIEFLDIDLMGLREVSE